MPAAEADLHLLREHIALDSPRAADRMGRKLVQACLNLGGLPHRGRPGLEPGTRELTTV